MLLSKWLTKDDEVFFPEPLKRSYLILCLTLRALNLPQLMKELYIDEKGLERAEALCKDVLAENMNR